MSDAPSSALSPREYLKIFFRRKWLIIIPVYAGLVLGLCTGMLLPKKYEASTVILIEEGKTDNPLFDKLAVSTTVVERMDTIRESMLGWYSLNKLVKRLGLDKDVKSEREMEELVGKIRKNIDIGLRGPNVLDLSYLGDTPESTQAVVKNITDIFIERNVEVQNRETSDAIKFIEEQLRVYRGKIKSSEIAQLQDQLDALLVDSTEQHPMVKQLRDQIANKRGELEKEKLEFTKDIMPNVETANPMIEEIRKTLDGMQGSTMSALPKSEAPEKSIYKVMLLDRLDNVMARDVRVNEEIYNMLLQRLETARITQRLQASKEGTKYTVLDPPRKPLQPDQPNVPFIAIIGLFLGAVIGVSLVVSAEFLDKSFLDVEDAKNYLGTPLLGAISKINTLDTIREEAVHQKLILGATLLSGVALIALTTVITLVCK